MARTPFCSKVLFPAPVSSSFVPSLCHSERSEESRSFPSELGGWEWRQHLYIDDFRIAFVEILDIAAFHESQASAQLLHRKVRLVGRGEYLAGLTFELRRAHQRSCESAAAEVRMHDKQAHEKLVEEALVEDDEAADRFVNPRD